MSAGVQPHIHTQLMRQAPTGPVMFEKKRPDQRCADHQPVLQTPVVISHDAVTAQLGHHVNGLALFPGETADQALERIGLLVIADEQILQADDIVDALVKRAERQHTQRIPGIILAVVSGNGFFIVLVIANIEEVGQLIFLLFADIRNGINLGLAHVVRTAGGPFPEHTPGIDAPVHCAGVGPGLTVVQTLRLAHGPGRDPQQVIG